MGKLISIRDRANDGSWNLSANDNEIEINLNLVADKSPVLNGRNGLSKKSAEPGNASYYYSMTRLLTDGSIRFGTESTSVPKRMK